MAVLVYVNHVSGKERFEMEQWVLLRKGADFDAIGKKYEISPRLASLIRNRDIKTDAEIHSYLNGSRNDLRDGLQMKDMKKAVELILEKITEKKKIRIIGDYDIDGINAVYILMEGLERLGAYVDSDIPDRMKEGYGLNRVLVERAKEAGVDTIITCDNGISAAGEIAYGKELGMSVIVTDHHEAPYEESEGGVRSYRLPPADAVIDPKQADCGYPFQGLCGAAVAYKLVEALYRRTGKNLQDIEYLIENVAIATVGDVMDLVDENRIYVKLGLSMLKHTKNPGLRALITCTGVKRERLSAYHIGFILGPCLNAGGRLDTAKRALALLRAQTEKEAADCAEKLRMLNESRKDMTALAVEKALCLAETREYAADRVLVLYLPDCHESLAGIVAGKVRERFYKPVFVLTDAEDGVKGSGRSIEAYSMYEELSKCKDLFTRFGGHKMAAGLSMKRENVESLRRRLNENCLLSEKDLTEKVVIDMELPFSCVTENFIEEITLLEPFGKGNTKPVFAGRDVVFSDVSILGKNRNVLKAWVCDKSGVGLEAVYFGEVQRLQEKLRERNGRLSVTFYPEVNEYRGAKKLQITITHYQ